MTIARLLAVVFAAVFGASLVGTGLLRRYALARSVLDIPNSRSSHTVPTPRGGGGAVVVAFLLGMIVLWNAGIVATQTAVAIGGAGVIVALIGFLDDHRSVAARWRLLAHTVAAGWALAWLGGLAPVELFGAVARLGWLGNVLAVLALVWLLNLYNFMDGIDGIAGVEAVTVCFGAVVIYWLRQSAPAESALPLLLGAASLGFLLWNFPSAKIFMGDAGSGFVGLILGVLAIRGASLEPDYLWSWVVLLGVFVVDATVTLMRRLMRGERVYEAHRSHAYQRATRRLGGHVPVTLVVGAINVFWLLPVALLIGLGRLDGALGALIAYLPLTILAAKLGAGTECDVLPVRRPSAM